ncbi:hypothetical protein G5C65_14055, partial [Streptomyces sp. SB3404]|nr:hypothetical protein [Streptomyces boncukensis]
GRNNRFRRPDGTASGKVRASGAAGRRKTAGGEVATARGDEGDQPRNLARSVTVE